jgi:hypothetical protein
VRCWHGEIDSGCKKRLGRVGTDDTNTNRTAGTAAPLDGLKASGFDPDVMIVETLRRVFEGNENARDVEHGRQTGPRDAEREQNGSSQFS